MSVVRQQYSLSAFPNDKADAARLSSEIRNSDITIALDHINVTDEVCDIWFKSSISTEEVQILNGIISKHSGEMFSDSTPKMPDGRPIVRADTRPLNTETFFTMAGDSTGIGDGISLIWDFSNDDDLYTGPEVPEGYKCKRIILRFNCPVYLKDGTIYFFDAPWGMYLSMDIVVPAGNYYPNPVGDIPSEMLGLPAGDLYSYAATDVRYQRYVNKHYMYGNCPMGDELNAEGAAVNALPVGWYIRGLIFTPDSDSVSKGYGELEMYRCHTALLPGQELESLHRGDV